MDSMREAAFLVGIRDGYLANKCNIVLRILLGNYASSIM